MPPVNMLQEGEPTTMQHELACPALIVFLCWLSPEINSHWCVRVCLAKRCKVLSVSAKFHLRQACAPLPVPSRVSTAPPWLGCVCGCLQQFSELSSCPTVGVVWACTVALLAHVPPEQQVHAAPAGGAPAKPHCPPAPSLQYGSSMSRRAAYAVPSWHSTDVVQALPVHQRTGCAVCLQAP